jgi:hypothetical protein
MKSRLWLNLWKSLGAVLFLVLFVGYGLIASDYAFSLRTAATLCLLASWFFSEATQVPPQLFPNYSPQPLSYRLKRVAEGLATFLSVAGALVFLLMFTGRLAPAATFLELGLAGLLAFSRINAQLRSWRSRAGDVQKG